MIFCNEIWKHFWKYALSWLIGYILTSRDVFYFLNVQAHCVYMTCYLSQCWPTFVVMIKDIDNNKLLEIWAVTKWQKSNYQKYGQWQSNKNDQKKTKIIKKNGQWQMIRIIKRSVNKWQVYKLSAEDKVSSMECQQLNGLFGARLASHPLPLIITLINTTQHHSHHHSSSFSTSLSSNWTKNLEPLPHQSLLYLFFQYDGVLYRPLFFID